MPDDWSFACPDWEAKLRTGRTPIPDLPLDPVQAEVAVALFDKLRIPNAKGQPTMGEAAGEWMRDIVRAAFASIDPATGERRVGEIFNLVPKKNGKTTNAAALGLIAMQMNQVPNIEGLIVGPTHKIAETCFKQACGMIRADKFLRDRFHIVDHKQEIIDLYRDPDTGVQMNGKLSIKSFDLKVVTGAIPAFAILDELHVMAQSSYAPRVIAQIRGGMITDPQSLLIIITTQSDTPPVGVFKEELQYARGVRDGRILGHVRMLPVLYEFPEAMQSAADKPWRDPKNWPMVLPNLGRGFTLSRLAAEYETERQKGESAERLWASQHLNIEIGLAMHADRWRGTDYWLNAIEPGLTLDAVLTRAEVVTIGIDGGGLDDLLGLAVLGRCRDTGKWLLWTKAWCDEGVLELRKEIAEQLRDFEKTGDLVIYQAQNGQFDLTEVQDIIGRIDVMGLLPKEGAIGLDTLGMPRLGSALRSIGIEFPKAAQVGQGVKMNGVILDMERRLKERSLLHCGQAAAAWCVGNAKAELSGSAVKITKQTAGTAKIDILVAAFNAFSMMSLDPEPAGKSVYQKRGLLTI